ncbi:MAG: hypothetical protein NTU53_25620 [Planctomycetota bacterium]|nr:hypothetical protein [Planctomycetota bacterium]
MIFDWKQWNIDHLAKHGVAAAEAQYVMQHSRPPYPREIGQGKYLVHGQTQEGRYLQVIFVYQREDMIAYEDLKLENVLALSDDEGPFVLVIHARELTADEKSRLRKR